MRQFRFRQRCCELLDRLFHLQWGFLSLDVAFDRNKTGTKSVDAGKVLVAVVLIDLALASKWGFFRNDGQAIGFHGTITAALADQLVNDHEFLRV